MRQYEYSLTIFFFKAQDFDKQSWSGSRRRGCHLSAGVYRERAPQAADGLRVARERNQRA